MYGDKSRGCTICEYLGLTEGLTTYQLLSELTDETSPITKRIPLLVRNVKQIGLFLNSMLGRVSSYQKLGI